MPQTIPSTQLPQKWYAIAVTDPNIAAWYAQLRGDHPDEPKSIIDHMMRSINDYGNGSGPGYDYRTAIEKGLRPSMQPDGKYHWGGDADDVIVKGEQHPTRNLTDQAMTRVQQVKDENVGRVKQIQKQAQDQQEVADNYQDLMRMYPESWSTVKSMMKEGVFDIATLSRAARLEAEKKSGTQKKRTTWEKTSEEYSRGREAIINDILWFEYITGIGNLTEEELSSLTKEAEERMAADPIDAEGWFEEVLLPFSSILYGIGKSTEYGAGGALAAMTPVVIAGQLGPQAAIPEELITLPVAGALGAKAGVASFWYMQGTGSIYKALHQAGVDPTIAVAVSSLGGVPYALIEQAQMKGLVPKAFTNEFADLLTKSVGRTLLNIGKQTGKTYTKENIQELAQESVLIASEEIGAWLENKINEGEIDQATADQIMDRMLTTAKQSMKAFIIPVGLGGAVSAGTGVSKVRKEQKAEAASIEATAVSRLSPEGVAGVDDQGRKVTLGRPAQLRVEEEGKPAEKRKTETDALSEVDAALDAGETTPGVAALAKHLISQDPDFDVRSSLAISNEVIKITDDYIRNVLGKEPEQFFEEEGITREEAEEYFATGSTQVDIQKGIAKTAIKLYQGHDADTLVEEWYHDFYEHMDEKDRKAFDAYHKKSKDTRSVEEHFGQEGRDYFFSKGMHKKAGSLETIFEKAKETLIALINRIEKLRGAKIPKKIQSIYTAAAERQLTPLTKKQKTDLKKRKLLFQLRTKPKSKEFKSWFGDSKVVDDQGNPMVMYHGTNESFDEFRVPKVLSPTIYFSNDPDVANNYSIPLEDSPEDKPNVMPVYLKIENPFNYTLDLNKKEDREVATDLDKKIYNEGFSTEVVDQLKKEGYDGIVDERHNIYQVFEPNQIKGQFNEKPTKGPKIMLQVRKGRLQLQIEKEEARIDKKFGVEKWTDEFVLDPPQRLVDVQQELYNGDILKPIKDLKALVNSNPEKSQDYGDEIERYVQTFIGELKETYRYESIEEGQKLERHLARYWNYAQTIPRDILYSGQPTSQDQLKKQFNLRPTSGPRIRFQVKKKKTAFPRVKKTGKYISLPDQINTPQKLFGLVTRLTNMAKEGRDGRYWYERSSDVILTAVNGDQKEAQKIAGLVGLFSQANALVPNWRAALRYYLNSKAGKPTEEGRFPGSQVPKAEKIMKGVIPLGIKTNNFYTNLMRHIDPSMKQGVTVDVWMMRALGYKNDAPTIAQYDRASKLITLAADRLGWEPHQVQSAVWTTIKSKWEAVEKKIKAEAISKEHFIVKIEVDGKEIPGHWKNEPTRIRYRNKFLKAAFKVPSSEVKALDFADLMLNELSTITMETVPGIENYFSKVNADRDFVQLNDMQVALNRLIIDENGNDRLAQAVGLLVMEDMSAPGAFVEKVSPGRQLTVVAPKGKRGDITGPVEEQIQEYAALFGLLFHQWGVGYHKPMVETTIKRSNLAEVRFENEVRLTPEETKKFTIAMAKEIETNYGEEHIYDVYLAPASTGYRWINLSDEIQNKDFHNLVDNVTKNTFPKNTYEIVVYKANSNLIYHSEKDAIDNNGKSYKNILSGSQRSSIYRGLLSNLGPQINQVYQDYAKENDWGKAPQKPQKIVFAVRHKRLLPKQKTPKQQALPGSEFLPELELDPERLRDIFQRKIQDKMNRLGHVMGKVKEIRPLSDEEDAYLAAEMYIGKAREKMDNFEDEIYSKKGSLLDRIVKAGYKLEDFGDYLHARHAKERNDHIAKIRDDMPDGGSGMTNKAAAEILKKRKGDKQIEGFANEFYRRVTKRALRARLNADLIDRETYDYLNDYYKHYVPLFVIKDVENRTTPTGKGLSIPQGAELKRAKGSAEERANPVFSGIHEMMGVIRRTEKNKVGLKFLDIAEEFTSESWTVKRQRYKPVYNKYGELEFMDPQFDLGDNVFAVRREGKLYLITINDEALARGLKNLGTEKANKYLMKANNYLRAIVTTWNPEFLITNFARDIQTALIHVVGEHKGVAGTVLKNTPKAMRGVWKNVRGKEANYWSERYDELKKAGGKVGWFDMDTLEEHQVKVEKELQRVQDGKGNARSAARALGDFIESANEAVESGVRLATFEALRKKGMSAERAAQVAKNITVNFNKKGELGTTMNSLYLFFNATIQGSARIGLSFARSKKTRAIMGGIVGMSTSISLVNFLIAPDEWEKKNQWEKDNYLIFMLPDGNDIRIRVPYGYNIFHVMGQTAADLIQIGVVEKQGIENLDYGAAIGRILGAASDAFSPFGDGSVIQAISPTLLDPLVQILENKKFHGGPIRPEVPTFVVSDTPNYKQYWDKNPPSWVSRAVTEGLSMITGGGKFEGIKKDKEGNPQDHYMPGWIDINPLDLDHIFGFATGGLGKFVSRSVDTGINFAVGRPTASKDIPFIRQFYGQPDKRAITEKRLIREYISKSKQHHYNHVELARFKRYVYDAIKLGQLTENQARMVKDENGNEIPKVIRDFLNNQRLTLGLSPIDYRKTGKSRSRTRPTRRRKKK